MAGSPPQWCCVQVSRTVPWFCSWHLKPGKLSFWSFCILSFIICPSCSCMQLFLVPYCFFVFCCSRRLFPKAKGPGSQVPGCLNINFPKQLKNMFTSLKTYNTHVYVALCIIYQVLSYLKKYSCALI